MLIASGNLRRSINSRHNGDTISFSNNMPYGSIHNEGGEIKITPKMRKFFWAMHRKTAGNITYVIKQKRANNTARNRKLSDEAELYKALALTKSNIKIPKRQFIGDHSQLTKSITKIVDENIDKWQDSELEQLINHCCPIKIINIAVNK